MSAIDSINYWLFAVSRRDRDGSANSLLEHLTEDGCAVVKMPEPDERGDYATRTDGKQTLTSVKVDSNYYGEPMVSLDTSSVRTFFKPDRAREIAAALLAAAAQVEVQS